MLLSLRTLSSVSPLSSNYAISGFPSAYMRALDGEYKYSPCYASADLRVPRSSSNHTISGQSYLPLLLVVKQRLFLAIRLCAELQ